MKVELVLAGVGGQGVLLMAEALGTAAVASGLNARVSEIHGMAQRGGSVVCHVRIGEGVLSPTVMDGQADAIVGLEPVEALRVIRYASRKTLVLLNTRPIIPPSVAMGAARYPDLEDILHVLGGFAGRVITLDAVKLAEEAGSTVAANTVMLGALASTNILPMDVDTLREAVVSLVPERFRDVNVLAFKLGYEAVKR